MVKKKWGVKKSASPIITLFNRKKGGYKKGDTNYWGINSGGLKRQQNRQKLQGGIGRKKQKKRKEDMNHEPYHMGKEHGEMGGQTHHTHLYLFGVAKS